MMASIKTNNAPAAIGPYSQGIVTDNLVFVSGQLPIDPATGNFAEGDIKELTRQCIRNIEAILKEAGTGLSKVIKTTIFVADLSNFAAVNEAYAEFFGESAPARSCVQVAAIPKGAQIEIEAIARIK
ncbi:RidA family protein [Lutispora thermophila]|uniref:RidA family protein n=2 Tax=Lutispora saccharofermentans TaxID=3024236 RepID=A0ABT1NLC5_9FIRM|nr:RidA family protein [Lutispora saccharofermentans]